MEELQKKIGYKFNDISHLTRALTHSSFTNGKRLQSNERFEFLGDSILGFTVSDYLFRNLSDFPEGMLTKIRSSIVCEDSLYNFAKEINLGSKLFLGKGEINTGGRDRKSILADAFESLIAAIYLDGGLDAAKDFILKFVPTAGEITKGKVQLKDYKTILQEVIQKNPEERVIYELALEKGAAHDKIFTVNVKLNGQNIGTGEGHNKKAAEQMAAKQALELMGYDDL